MTHRPRRRLLAAAAIAAALAATTAPAAAQPERPGPPVNVPAPPDKSVPGLPDDPAKPVRVIVKAPPGFARAGLERFGDGTLLRGTMPSAAAAALARAPGLEVEVDHPLTLHGAAGNDQTDANVLAGAGADGTNRTIAVIDSGVDFTHGALAPANRGEACFESFSSSCAGGTQSAVGPGTANPVTNHGTFVAGVAASRDGGAARGAAPDAGIYAVRVFAGNGNAQTSDVVAALQHVRAVAPSHAAAGRPIVAINLSLGFAGPLAPCSGGTTVAEIDAAVAAGISVVISSGNAAFTNGVEFPGCTPSALTVGAVVGQHVTTQPPPPTTDNAQDDQLANYSNAGAAVDVLAPGGHTSTVVGGYSHGNGTSFAAPTVAGILANLSEARPTSTRAQREAAVAKSGVFVGDHRVGGGGYGRFRVDADDALTRLDEILTRDANGFTPITPARVFSSASGAVGGPNTNGNIGAGQLPGSSDWFIDIAKPLGISPSDLEAVSLNVTAHDSTGPGYLSVWPDSTTWPGTSSLNLQPGQTIANAQYTRTGPAGGITLRVAAGSAPTNVAIDVTGYWGPGSDYTPVGPSRVLAVSMAPGEQRLFDPRGLGGVPASGVGAVVLSTATVAYGNAGYLAIVPSDQPVSTSIQNFDSSETLAAMTLAKLGPDGRLKLVNGTNGVIDLYLDAAGWVSTTAQDLVPANPPGRLIDTRICQGACGPVGAQSYTLINLTWCACDSVVLNLTGVTPASAGHATMLPGPNVPALPGTSNLNMAAGGVIANLVTVKLPPDRHVRLFSYPSSHYLVDFVGSTT